MYPYLTHYVCEYLRLVRKKWRSGPFPAEYQELARQIPEIMIKIGEEREEVRQYLTEKVNQKGLEKRITLVNTPLFPLLFKSGQFDFVIFRGAFFFLDEFVIREIYRVLSKDGVGFVGGGYGRLTPQEIIDPIADESRRLNYLLGKGGFQKKIWNY